MALYDKASLVLIPSGTKAGKVYSQKPVPSNDVLTDDTLNNGDFEQGSSGWTLQSGTVVFSNGNAEFQGSSIINQYVSGNDGETIIVTYTVESADANARLQLYNGSWFDVEDSVGTHTVSFVGFGTFFYLRNNDSGNITLSSVSVKKIVDGDFDFTRSTYATRVNSQGLIEKERSNLLLQSNNFDTTWSSSNLNTPTNGFAGYDGSSDAWKIEANASNFARVNQSVNLTGICTASVYAKKAEYDYIGLYFSGVDKGVMVSLVDGTVVNPILNYPDVYADAEDVGGGWYRISIAHTLSGSNELRIYPSEGNQVSTNTTTNEGIYIQDAQLEQGLVATDSIPTTSYLRS